jgi:hypothetical protein
MLALVLTFIFIDPSLLITPASLVICVYSRRILEDFTEKSSNSRSITLIGTTSTHANLLIDVFPREGAEAVDTEAHVEVWDTHNEDVGVFERWREVDLVAGGVAWLVVDVHGVGVTGLNLVFFFHNNSSSVRVNDTSYAWNLSLQEFCFGGTNRFHRFEDERHVPRERRKTASPTAAGFSADDFAYLLIFLCVDPVVVFND